jgi:hypothetical protein
LSQRDVTYLRLEVVPHFIVKTPIEEEELKRELMHEYRALLRFLLHDQGQLSLSLIGAGDYVEVGYALTRDPADVLQYIRGLRRFLRLVPAEPPPASVRTRTLNRRVHLAPVGAVNKSAEASPELLPPDAQRYTNFDPDVMGQASIRQVILNPLVQMTAALVRDRFTPGKAYVMPVPAALELPVAPARWRNTLASLLRDGGSVTLTCRRLEPDPDDTDYALLCLQYYLGTNSDKLAAEEIDRHTAVLRAVFSRQPVYTLDVALAGPSGLILDSFLRDTDPDAFELSPTTLDASIRDQARRRLATERIAPDSRRELVGPGMRSRDGASRESLARTRPLVEDNPARRYGQLFVADELTELLLPPFTFRDALPGVAHFVPKPFQEPSFTPAAESAPRVTVGETDTGKSLQLTLEDFTRHVFVTGASGAGKSNTMMSLVAQLHGHGCPVLVVDPVKRDFEPLLESLGLADRIFDFRRRWLRFNPFVPPANVTLYAHCVVLAKTLAMLFPTNAVAYEILLSMVKHTYWHKLEAHRRDGKPMTIGEFVQTTGRLLRQHPFLAPTFAEFLDLGMDVLRQPGEGSGSQWTREAIDHFERRWANLRRSALSIMLSPGPAEVIDPLFESTALIEFGAWFDQNEANAAFALIFSMMYEQRLSDAEENGPRLHRPAVALLDEAHRIVPAHAGGGDDSLVSAGGEAAALLTQMIAECRALGQGIILGEQSASKIDPSVLINTSTKIVHTVLFGRDKDYLGSALSLSDAERDYLSYLPVGEALAFSPASYQPLAVRMPRFEVTRRAA